MLIKIYLSTEQMYKIYSRSGICICTYTDMLFPIPYLESHAYIYQRGRFCSKLDSKFIILMDINYEYIIAHSSKEFRECISLREEIVIGIYDTKFIIIHHYDSRCITIYGENASDVEKLLI